MADSDKPSAGVQELIERLRQQGTDAGRREAERVVEEARKRAADLISEAREEAESIRSQDRSRAEAERAAAQEALALAVRDTLIRLRAEITSNFAAQLRRLVSAEMRDVDFLRRLILEVAGYARPTDPPAPRLDILIASDAVEGQLGTATEKEGRVNRFVLGLASEMLREGVDLKPALVAGNGIRVRLVGKDLEIDLTDQAVAEMLRAHLLPRFHALLDGIVR